ncbi:MAG: hypothetical protein RL660_2564 [Bacteroidota bacterium]|jgi:hypothetical protein
MCTVTYIPKAQGYVLTHNRDEKLTRAQAYQPQVQDDILCPIDADAKGTWVGLGKDGTAVCLLNGAFVPHIVAGSYARSRGTVVLDLLAQPDVLEAIKAIELSGVEPFTVIVIHNNTLLQLRWDGSAKHIATLPIDQAQIWSSCTLYDATMHAKRIDWFNSFLKSENAVDNILTFHQTQQENDAEVAVLMQRPLVHTVSTTCISVDHEEKTLIYIDHVNKQSSTLKLD